MLIKGLIVLIIGLTILYYMISRFDKLCETEPVLLNGLCVLDIFFLTLAGISITASIVNLIEH